MIRKIYHLLIKSLPFKIKILTIGAALPIRYKTRSIFRILSNIAQYCEQNTVVISNFGINNNLKIKVKITHSLQAFGTPALYIAEYSTLKLASSLLKHSDTFYDIGSHLGYFCFYIENDNPLRIPIRFFEPDSELYREIIKNKNDNFLQHINGDEIAVSNTDDYLTFYKNNTDTSSGSLKNTFQSKHNIQEVKVKSNKFDTLTEHLPFQKYLLKVDVESAEFEFIEGAQNNIDKIKYLIIELLQESIDKKFPELLISKFNFHAYYIDNFTLQYSKKGEYIYHDPYYNWLFTKDSPEELRIKLSDTLFKVQA